MNKVRILLADDHPQFLEIVERLLGPTFEIVGIVGDGRALFEAGLNLKPDVIVTDISMPVMNGIEAVDELRKSKLYLESYFSYCAFGSRILSGRVLLSGP